MGDPYGWVSIAPSNASVLADALRGDLMLFTGASNQRVLVGTRNGAPAALAVAGNSVGVGGRSNPSYTLDVGGAAAVRGGLVAQGLVVGVSAANADAGVVAPYTPAWSVNAAGNAVYVLGVSAGIGTASPAYKLHVVGDPTQATIYTNGDVVAASDARGKTEVRVIDGAMQRVRAVRGYTFERADACAGAQAGARRHAGVLAQEMARALPEVVYEDAATGRLSVAYGNVTALLIEALREVDAAVGALGARMGALEARVTAQEARVTAQEARAP